MPLKFTCFINGRLPFSFESFASRYRSCVYSVDKFARVNVTPSRVNDWPASAAAIAACTASSRAVVESIAKKKSSVAYNIRATEDS